MAGVWFWLLAACGGGGAERQSAQEALVDALSRRDAHEVSAAARRASAWEGEDPVLDGLLGDAVANVLMRPEQGWPLLLAAREVGGPAWESAALGAMLRAPQGSLEPDIAAQLGRSVSEQGVRAEVRAAALVDPSLGWETLEAAVADCGLVDAAPARGKQLLEGPVPRDLPGVARQLGAERVVLARPQTPQDASQPLGSRPWRCKTHRLLRDEEIPERIARNVLVAVEPGAEARTEGQGVYLWVVAGEDGPVALAGSGGSWISAWRAAADRGAGTVIRAEEDLGVPL